MRGPRVGCGTLGAMFRLALTLAASLPLCWSKVDASKPLTPGQPPGARAPRPVVEEDAAQEQLLLLPPDRAVALPQGAHWQVEVRGRGAPLEAMTLTEGVAMMGTRRATVPGPALQAAAVRTAGANISSLPLAYDVRDRWWSCSAVSRVLNQGPCGCCYAMASADVMSASMCIRSGGSDDLMLSAQDMLSCSESFSCLGATIPDALDFLCKHGAAEESCVTYRAGDSWDHFKDIDPCRQTCEMDEQLVVRHAPETYRLLNDETAVKEAIMNVGPVVAYVDAYRSLVHYRAGVYQCPQSSLCTGAWSADLDCPLPSCSSPACANGPGHGMCDDCLAGGHGMVCAWGGRGLGGRNCVCSCIPFCVYADIASFRCLLFFFVSCHDRRMGPIACGDEFI